MNRHDPDTMLARAIARRARPPRPSAASNVLTFGWRAVLKIRHVPEQLFDVVGTPIMFTFMFTFLFGGALAGSPDAYLQFLLPGILAQTVIFTSVYTGVSLNTDISKGMFDRFRSLPIWRPAPLAGAMLGDVLRYCLASLVTILVGLAIGYRPDGGVVGVVLGVGLLVVFAFGLGWIFTLMGLVMRTPATVMTVSMLILFPLTFASNVFVDPATMPGWLETAVWFNPVTHVVTAVRGLMGGVVDGPAIFVSLAFTVAMTAVFGPIAAIAYARR
ncbi:ABC transporter permease [Pelagibacterium montanilacus]|uniref:ABC transporter permease n=1 Tax=Pelagibacterium montanilacus TaxID=2185280 RepID=UPI000F8F0EDA|nr:ABC transporter permease [Pelagibacterium montanilacus]